MSLFGFGRDPAPPRFEVLTTLRSGAKQHVNLSEEGAAALMEKIKDAMRDGNVVEVRYNDGSLCVLFDGREIVAASCGRVVLY